METERLKKIKVHAEAIAKLLDEETDSQKVKTLEGIEQAVRKHLIDYVNREVVNLSWCAFPSVLKRRGVAPLALNQ